MHYSKDHGRIRRDYTAGKIRILTEAGKEDSMSGMVCDVTGCIWNDGTGGCNCDGIYISDVETGEPACVSAEFLQSE